jgi:hypothetical protein
MIIAVRIWDRPGQLIPSIEDSDVLGQAGEEIGDPLVPVGKAL